MTLELDIYWAVVGGADTATVLRGLGGADTATIVDSYRYLVEAGLSRGDRRTKRPKEPFGAMTSASRASSRTVILVPCGPSGLRRM